MHILLRKFPQLEGKLQTIWDTFLSLFSLVLRPKSVSSDLVVLGSQLSLESNQLCQTQPKPSLSAPLSLPPKSKSVNKSDFPKNFLSEQNSSKLTQLLHPRLSLDCLLLGSVIHAMPDSGSSAEDVFKFFE